MYYLLSPEVAGQLGERTIIPDPSNRPVIIEHLHYRFDDWLGDDLLAGFGCFLCSNRLAIYLKGQNFTGLIFKDCETSKSELFFDLNSNLEIPLFYWLVVVGRGQEDFSLSPNGSLIVSQKALDILKKFNLKYCDIEEYV